MKLYGHDGLGFHLDKWSEFLISPDSSSTVINSKLNNTKVNCQHFMEGNTSDFLAKNENLNTGDLQMMISKAFYYKGAYYVHVWRLSNSDKIFHYKRQTFKFNKNEERLNIGFLNYYQKGYASASSFLKTADKKTQVKLEL
ncbi:MAG: hypothetical protein HRT72_06440 [Flavobacteriales bacterium]|nr:hypothetical protein [Flavobacteriales bacterium]